MPAASVLILPDAPRYTVVAASPAYLRAVGMAKDALQGRGLFDAFPANPDEAEFTGQANVAASFATVLATRSVDILPLQRYDVPTADGRFEERYWKAVNSPVLDEDGNVQFILHTPEDITERVIAERKEEQYRHANKVFDLFMQAPAAVCIVRGPDFIVDLANGGMLDMLGRTPQIIGRPIVEALPEARVQGLIDILTQVMTTRQPYQVSSFPATLLINGERETRYFDLVFNLYDRAVTGLDDECIFCLAHNVTEQVEARKKIADVTERLNYRNAIFEAQNDATPDGVLIVDGNGKMILYNKRFAEIWKMPQAIIDSRDDDAALRHAMTMLDDPDKFMTRVEALYEKRSEPSQDVLVFRDGRVVERTGAPIVSEEGTYYGWSWYFRDISRSIKQEQRFRNVVEQAPDPILILMGEDLVLEVANKALLDLWKVDETAIGRKFLDILPEMKDQVFVNLLKNVLHTGEPFYGNEVPAIFIQEGKEITRYVNFSYQPYRELNREISGVLITATDVTGQVLARQQKEKTEANFRSLLMQAPIGICILQGEDFIVELANDSYLEIVQRERDAFLGRPLWEGLPEVRTQGFDTILRNVLASGEAFIGREFKVVINRQGREEVLYVDFVYEPLREVDGDWDRIMALAIDVTANVLSRKKIEEAEERARLAIESAELGAFEVDLLTQEIIASERMDEIMGVSHTNVRTKYIEAVHPDDRAIRQAAYDVAYQTGKLEYDGRVVWQDGSIHWMRVKGRIFFDRQRVPFKMLGVVQDITEQKQFSEELTRQVEERTQQLQESNLQLQKSNEELEQFAYVSSHDLQEPLRKIKLFAGMILESESAKLGELARSRFDKIIDAADRMSSSLRDLLEYASLSREEEVEPVDLNKVIENVEVDLELVIAQKNAAITKSGLPVLYAIPLQMHQLFYNLLNNSLKFSKPDVPPVISVSSRVLSTLELVGKADLKSGPLYEIRVTDNGIGFDAVHSKKIFTIFQRLHDKKTYSGTGIGLALCKRVVQNHGGDIYTESQPGVGTTFIILLPVG
ncbi:MAG: hypothetical protein JWP27_2760 [Flaviaesturariibacter sp.]|nr:hypothetical protein [Flaviaesturariibacter sp.]